MAEEIEIENNFIVNVDGTEIFFPDQKPFTSSLRPIRFLYVPLRAVSEALGYEVSWDDETQTATIKKGERTASFDLGDICYVNGEKKKTMFNCELKNDRIMVSQYAICHAVDCTMSWDDINRVLYLYSNEKYENGVPFTQGTQLKANTKSEEYNEFYSMAEPAFIFPGLNEHLIPQGIAYRKETNQFYLSGYYEAAIKNRNSAIIVVDASTGKISAQYQLLQPGGKNHSGHMGGIAITEKDVYFENGKKIQRISLATLDAAPSGSAVEVEENIMLTMGQNLGNDFLEYSDGYLWVGNYYAIGVEKFTKLKSTDEYPFIIRGYKLDMTQPNGFAAENRVEGNEWYDYVPEIVYEVAEDKIQGMTTVGDYLITSTSLWENSSNLYVYNRAKNGEKIGELNMSGRTIPVVHLNLEKTVTTMPYSEEITMVDGNLYLVYESGGIKFRKDTNKYPTDSVWKIDFEKLISK